jgi:hypothetical protein
VLGIKLRAGLLGLLAMLLVGSLAPAAALAEGGPFCHHRPVGGKGEGELIKAQSPEGIAGSGGVQHLEGILPGTAEVVNFVSSGVQIKGVIYNNEDQCQAKLEVQYNKITIEKPQIEHCAVSLPNNNVIKMYAHAAWKWRGTEAEQKENPITQGRDWVLLPVELQQHATELPKTETPFMVMNIKSEGGSCLLANTQAKISGSMFSEAVPATKEVFETEEKQLVLPNGTLQQFWNGAYPLVGARSSLLLGKEEFKIEGAVKFKPVSQKQKEPQEIGYFEK